MDPAAFVVCRVDKTRWPVKAALIPRPAVSLSLISPTMIISGSCLTRALKPEAKDKHELARILRQEGFLLTSAVLGEKEAKKGFEIRLPALFGVSLKEKVFFTRNLKVMIAA
ncbi:unnamed protein product, partial [marine sediment metagenome]